MGTCRIGAMVPGIEATIQGRLLLSAALLATAMLAACDAADSAAVAELTVVDPWVRSVTRPAGSGAPGAPPSNGAAYLTLRNGGPGGDAIVAVGTEAADTAELHGVTFDGGIVRMRAVDSVAAPAGGSAVLEPGATHIMLVGLNRDLAEGDTVRLTLRMRSGRSVEVRAAVKRTPTG